jgi:hypothetical protein
MIRVIFHHSDKPREVQLAHAFQRGVERYGDACTLWQLGAPRPVGWYDLACMVGVKSDTIWRSSVGWARHRMMLDKGYSRHKIGGFWEYWRLALDAHQPTRTTLMAREFPVDRMRRFRWLPKLYIRKPRAILLAGSSEKYHKFHDLPHPTAYAKDIIAQLGDLTSQEIIYRPKPSWKAARPIEGSTFSPAKQDLTDLWDKISCMVTHGSNACVDAMLAGIPTVTLGDGVAAAIGGTQLSQALAPPRPERAQWLANLAYHQYSESEMTAGIAWPVVRRWLDG